MSNQVHHILDAYLTTITFCPKNVQHFRNKILIIYALVEGKSTGNTMTYLTGRTSY